MKIILKLLLLSTLPFMGAFASPLKADTNAVGRAEEIFAGRFTGIDVYLKLKADRGRWSGSILFKGKTSLVLCTNSESGLAGTFGDGKDRQTFNVGRDGSHLTFTAGQFSSTLTPVKLPPLAGKFVGRRVTLRFTNESDGAKGELVIQDQSHPFSATVVDGELAGEFQNGAASEKFSVACEPAGIVFRATNFADLIVPFVFGEDCRAAAERGEAWAEGNLAASYFYGRGLDFNQVEAVRWWRKAAERRCLRRICLWAVL